jgi:phospholipid/cholesterol/gamma-HCH transport system substrate-binding protein
VQLDDEGVAQPAVPPGPSGLPRLPLRSSPLSRLADQGPAILGQVEEATHRINTLLGDDNQKRFSAALDSMGQAASSVATLTQRLDTTVKERLDPTLAALPPLVGDARRTLKALEQAGSQVSTLAIDIGQTNKRLGAEGGALDQITQGTQSLARAADQFGSVTLPRLNRAADDTSRAARQFGRTAGGINENPQLFIYGAGRAGAGPGEPGFEAPKVQP